MPLKKLPECIDLVNDMFGSGSDGSVQAAGTGSFLEATMFPINAVIHPARLITLLSNWKEGDVLDENPLFYENFTDEAVDMMNMINADLIAIGKGLTEKGCPVDVPHIFDWLAVHVYDEPPVHQILRHSSRLMMDIRGSVALWYLQRMRMDMYQTLQTDTLQRISTLG